MGRANNSKYDRRELVDILINLGFSVDINNGKVMGKGDHTVYSHKLYDELKVCVPIRKSLSENEMSGICSNLVIILKILGEDVSDMFTHKEGVEGKLMKTIKNAEKNICSIFSLTARNCLGLRDDDEILDYIERKRNEIIAVHSASDD